MSGTEIGVAAVQGAVSEHLEVFRGVLDDMGVGGSVRAVRTLDDFLGVDALVLPGGESTAISRLLVSTGIHDELVRRVREEDMPVLGTCAGLILLASVGDGEVERTGTRLLGLLDAAVDRNAFGRQRESFESPLDVELEGDEWADPFPGVFIRAPAVRETWGGCEALCRHEGKVVGVRQGRRLGLAFHPELAGDLRFHRLFVSVSLR